MREETQVCIVGGGLIGMLCAYEAVEAGLDVFLVDKNFAGSGDNAVSALFQYNRDPATHALLKAGRAGWQAMAENLEDPIGLHENGAAMVALTAARARELSQNSGEGYSFYHEHPAMAKALGVNRVQEDLCGLLYEQAGAHIYASLLHETLRQALVRKGVMVWGSDRVAEIVVRDGAVKGIKTTHDELVAEHTILCAGAWTGRLMAQLGLQLPLRPARSHRIEMSVTDDTPKFPLINQLHKGDIIIRPMRNGRMLITYTGLMDQQQATWSRHVDHEMVNLVLKNIAGILPAYAHGKAVKTETNTLAVTPNNLPYIGRVAAMDGLYVATGMNGDTFSFGPAVAKALMNLIQKKEPEVDLSAFSPDRYIHLHQQEDSFAEQEAIIRETFGNLDPEELEKKVAQAQENHEKARAEAQKVVEGKALKENKQNVQYAKVDENLKDE